jgi:hypothetical protein
MSEQSKDKKSWRKTGCIWLILCAVIAGVLAWFDLDAIRRGQHVPTYWQQFLFSVIGAALLLGLWWLIRWPFASWRNFRRTLVGLAAFATLAAVFYTEENWRGKRAWENCKAELEAKGVVLDWNKFIPPPVPDDQNFFKAPKMAEWFVGRNRTNDLLVRMSDKKFEKATGSATAATNLIATTAAAKEYLAWSEQFEPDFDLIREALKRPYARMNGDYSRPFEISIPNFVAMRMIAQTLAQRTHCYLLLGQPGKALPELALLNGYRRLLEGAPTGKPMTLVTAMINVAVAGVYVQAVAEGIKQQAWQDFELEAIQAQLAEINLTPCFSQAFACEPAAVCHTAEIVEPRKMVAMEIVSSNPQTRKSHLENLWSEIKSLPSRLFNLVPRGWIYQNMATHAKLSCSIYDSLFDANGLVTPHLADQTSKRVFAELEHKSLFNLLSRVGLPNYSKALQGFARNQTLANQAQVVCALERYRLAHGGYPETLATLMPRFIEKLPPDIIGGQPLHYRRTDDGKFLLYSVGWNETDDGGVTAKDKSGNEDKTQGDWVWKN